MILPQASSWSAVVGCMGGLVFQVQFLQPIGWSFSQPLVAQRSRPGQPMSNTLPPTIEYQNHPGHVGSSPAYCGCPYSAWPYVVGTSGRSISEVNWTFNQLRFSSHSLGYQVIQGRLKTLKDNEDHSRNILQLSSVIQRSSRHSCILDSGLAFVRAVLYHSSIVLRWSLS
jgi:hypothetical protein